ncbi:hypothetical protein AB0E88_18445 [Streptomyces sp. NPDC028635]|uniref:hypothetical protein n=1 Tax=Streptomyces sp. NPDC028635 TaxID=3154800 RepID=UPI00340DCC9E
MGIESDKVVYEYLSRVGDVAQQRQLPSATRMRLVAGLRDEIDKRRARTVVDSPAAVRRIIERLGTPDDLVAAAGGATGPTPPSTAVPEQRDGGTAAAAAEPPTRRARFVPRPRPTAPPAAPASAPSPPHLASAAELGGPAVPPDWWRTDFSDEVPGFTGGVEIPDLLKPPPRPQRDEPDEREEPAAPAPEAAAEDDADAPVRRRLFARPAGRWRNPLLLLAAAALVAGAVLGNGFALLAGWLIAYASRRLTRAEAKWAVLGLPGAALAAGLVWLWGRTQGRWGTPIADGHMNEAIAGTWPWVVRGAAVASALFLVWRSQKER